MYSPTIHPTLIPVLYHLGQQQKRPMTEVVNYLLLDSLDSTQLPPSCLGLHEQAKHALMPSAVLQEAA